MLKSYTNDKIKLRKLRQEENSKLVHHPKEKIKQIKEILIKQENQTILELFSGRGNLTKIYKKYGKVDAFDRKYLKTGDSFHEVYKLISNRKIYDIIDLDPYGFPNRLFPHIFLLIEQGIMFITMPKPYVNVLNRMTQIYLTSYFGKQNPSEDEIIEKIKLFAIGHWRKLELINSIDLKSVWRFAFKVEKVKANEYSGIKVVKGS